MVPAAPALAPPPLPQYLMKCLEWIYCMTNLCFFCHCQVAASLGMVPAAPALAPPAAPQYLGVHLDGRPIGFVEARAAPRLAARLHAIKAGRLASEMGRSVPGLAPLRVGHIIHNPCLCGCLLVSFLEGVEGSIEGFCGGFIATRNMPKCFICAQCSPLQRGLCRGFLTH